MKEEQKTIYESVLFALIAEALGKNVSRLTYEDLSYFLKYYSK
jgi:hypothetical protein